MEGLLGLALALAAIAGICAFLITYDEALHRFPRAEAMRQGVRTGLVATAFFAGLGTVVIVMLLR